MSTLAQPLPLDRGDRRPQPTEYADLGWVVEMAHDLRSPLSSILVLAESLRDGRSGGVNDVQKHQLGLIYSAALYLCAEASDLTELMRGSDRLSDHEPKALSLADLLDAVRAMVQPMVEEKRLGALDAARVEFSVRDTGPGIAPDALPGLFQAFPRGPLDLRQHFSGSGLGLAICRKVVAAMGAELRMDTVRRHGKRFHFELALPPAEP